MLRNSKHSEHTSSSVGTKEINNVAPDNRPSDMWHALIKRIHVAVKEGFLKQPFTAQEVEKWMVDYDIRKEDGEKYKAGYVATLLSTSYIRKKMKKNRNSIWLDRRKNIDGIFEYWFIN